MPVARWLVVLVAVSVVGCGGGVDSPTDASNDAAPAQDAARADGGADAGEIDDGGSTDAAVVDAVTPRDAADSALADAAMIDAGSADGGTDSSAGDAGVTAAPIWLILNGVSGICPTGLRPVLYPTVRPIVDGTASMEIGVGTMLEPGTGSHHLVVEYNVFDCPDTILSTTPTTIASQRTLYAVSGAHGAEHVTTVDLTGRWQPVLTQLVLVHLSPTTGPLAYRVDGAGTTSGTFAYEDVVVAPIDPAATTTVTVMTPTPTMATSHWTGFGPGHTDAVFCALRDRNTGGPIVACSATTLF
jgi:hypothetical protein